MASSSTAVNPGSLVRSDRHSWANGPALVLYLTALALLAQLGTAFRYGIFRDELYYIACSEHLAWGYVDQPPLVALIVWIERHVGGDSLLSLRFLPAVAFAITVWLAGKMARDFGGGRYAQVLAALAVLLAPGYLALNFHLITMNSFEPPIWTACAWVVLRIVQTGNQRLWLWFGLLAGIGLENKYGILTFGLGVFLGVLLTRERRALRQPWIWLGALLALLIWLPNLVWNIQHHWPFLQLIRNVRANGRDVALDPAGFLGQQMFFMGAVTTPLWIAGLWHAFAGREQSGTRQRGCYAVLGWTFAVVFVTFMVLQGKTYYVWPVYPMMYALGGVAVESAFAHRRLRWAKPAYATAVVIFSLILLPMALPVLPPYTFIWYEHKLHLVPPAVEHQRNGPLEHQIYADMFGWKEMAASVARAYYSLPPAVREKTGIAAGGYGEAAAIDFYGPEYGLPKSISGHQSYWFWGPREYTGESLLLLREKPRRAAELCENATVIGKVEHPLARRDEEFNIYWCHPMRWNLQQMWSNARHWD